MTDTKMCPYCGEDIKFEAIKCKHCQSMLSEEDNALVGADAQTRPQQTSNMVEELKGKLKKAFEDNITESETIDVKLQVHVGEGIVVTDKRVMIIKAGMVSDAGFFGANCKSFYFNHITSVDLRLGVMGGHIQLTVAGSTDIKGKGFLDMGKAENAATFTMDYKDRMKKVAELIRERVQLSHTQGTTLQQTQSVAEQIKELASLKQQGILSEEEFDQAKKKLLNL